LRGLAKQGWAGERLEILIVILVLVKVHDVIVLVMLASVGATISKGDKHALFIAVALNGCDCLNVG
jgi:hypothetical protein